ncbi:MAG: hypothetical protein NVSMB5_03610 [Candidatus Velthaea sp.]
MTRAIFQAGLSWALIDARWEAFRSAFDGFDAALIAHYGEADVQRLMETEGVIHSRAKIEGTIANARTLIGLAAEHGSINAYVARFADYDALWKDAHKRFKHLGDLNCYYWLFRTGAPVPQFEQWMTRHTVDHPRVREMVFAGRADGTSTER